MGRFWRATVATAAILGMLSGCGLGGSGTGGPDTSTNPGTVGPVDVASYSG